ncbi:MAG: AAA family ATPase [Phocaeicola sp.]
MKKVTDSSKEGVLVISGPALSGKTTRAFNTEKPLFLKFSPGWECNPGMYSYKIYDWLITEELLRQFEIEEVKLKYSTIVIDDIQHARRAARTHEKDAEGAIKSFVNKVRDLGYSVVIVSENLHQSGMEERWEND